MEKIKSGDNVRDKDSKNYLGVVVERVEHWGETYYYVKPPNVARTIAYGEWQVEIDRKHHMNIFSESEMARLTVLRDGYVGDIDKNRLGFARWLFRHGKLNEGE